MSADLRMSYKDILTLHYKLGRKQHTALPYAGIRSGCLVVIAEQKDELSKLQNLLGKCTVLHVVD